MAFHRLTRAALTGEPFPLYGTGDQIRDFTYVADIVQANLRAAAADLEPGVVMNIAGGGESRLGDLIDLAGELAGRPVNVEALPEAAGDIMRTGGDTTRAVSLLGWIPTTDVETGLKAELEWMRDLVA
jgi:nucleoside-diphosphate-sugar epimerase